MEDKKEREAVEKEMEKEEKEERRERAKVEAEGKGKGKVKSGGGGLSLFKILLINILVSFLVSVGVVYVYDRYYAQKVVAFDLRGYMLGLRDMYLAGKINDEGLKIAIDAVHATIQKQGKNRVVLMKDVILSPVAEIGYPVRIEFSSHSLFHNGTLGGGIGGGIR
jgi:hypothetical protein